MKAWRLETPCEDCPFNGSGPGLHLRRSLRPGRWRGILRDLRGDLPRTAPVHFPCHRTTDETGDGSNLLCAGALAYQAKLGVSSDYQQICERLEWLSTHKEDEP